MIVELLYFDGCPSYQQFRPEVQALYQAPEGLRGTPLERWVTAVLVGGCA